MHLHGVLGGPYCTSGIGPLVSYFNNDFLFCYSLCQDMKEYEAAGSSKAELTPSIQLNEFGKRRTIKPDSYFSDEDASD